MSNAIIFDIETLSQDPDVILANAPIWDIEEAKTRVPKNYKQEAAVNGWLEKDQADYTKNLLEKAALNAETATVAVFGLWEDDDMSQSSQSTSPESDIVQTAIDVLNLHIRRDDYVLTWNGMGFDIPFLLKRAWILGIHVPSKIFNPLSRYPVSDKVVDMMRVWQAGNYKAPFTSLNNAMKAVGMPGKPDGSEFAKMWAEDKAKALKYSEDELLGQAALYRKMGVDL